MANLKPVWTEDDLVEDINDRVRQEIEARKQMQEEEIELDYRLMNQAKDMKFDKGKPQAHIPFEDFPRALFEVMRVSDFGANKYERSSWRDVPNRDQRYRDAYMRHFFQLWNGQRFDEETGLDHRAHIVWGLLASMQVDFEADKEKEGA